MNPPDTAPAQHAPGRTLSRRSLFFYSLPEMPLQVAAIPVLTFIPNYYGSELGISLETVGLVWMIAMLIDGITDPVVGYASDRTVTRWGRRRVWMVASVPLMLLSVYQLFFPDHGVGATYLLFWMIVLWIGWTMLLIPYYAWGAELSADYHERAVVSAWRTAVGMFANVLSKLVPVVALYLFAYGGTQEVLQLIGILLMVLLPLTVFLCVWQVPETLQFVPARMPVIAGIRVMWRNGPFKRLLLAFFINYIGTSISSATIIFYIRGVLGEEKAGITMILCYYLANLLSIPFWLKVSHSLGKHRAWVAGLLIFVVASPAYLLLGQGDFYWMLPIAAITGVGGGAFWVMPNAMKADVIDLDTLKSGENRAATYFAVWSLAIKLAMALGPWLSLSVLGWVGYDATPGAHNTVQQVLGLKLIFVFSTPLFYGLAALIAWRYPITEERHRLLRAALQRRVARVAPDNP